MKYQPGDANNRMSVSQIEITDDPSPSGFANSLRLMVWVSQDDSQEKMGAAAKAVAMDFLERALADMRRDDHLVN